MSEAPTMSTPLETRAALATCHAGRKGASSGEPGIVLKGLPEGFVLHLLARPFQTEAQGKLEALAAELGGPLRPTGPGQWFLAGDRVLSPAEFRSITASLEPEVAVSDQAHGRVRIAVTGAAVEQMLAKLMAADLSLPAFPVGHGTTLFAGHVSVHALRTAADGFELMVLRGFAVDLFETLEHASLEFGVLLNPVAG